MTFFRKYLNPYIICTTLVAPSHKLNKSLVAFLKYSTMTYEYFETIDICTYNELLFYGPFFTDCLPGEQRTIGA